MRCRYIPPPDEKAREAIFEVYLKKYGVSDGVDVRVLSEMTEGYSGADIENVCRESVYGCLREKSECVEVSVESLMKAVKASKPSLGREAVLKYEAFEKAFFVSCVVCCSYGSSIFYWGRVVRLKCVFEREGLVFHEETQLVAKIDLSFVIPHAQL